MKTMTKRRQFTLEIERADGLIYCSIIESGKVVATGTATGIEMAIECAASNFRNHLQDTEKP